MTTCSTCCWLKTNKCTNSNSHYFDVPVSQDDASEHTCVKWQKEMAQVTVSPTIETFNLNVTKTEPLTEPDFDFLTNVRDKLFSEILDFA